jgi:hypothetical protein
MYISKVRLNKTVQNYENDGTMNGYYLIGEVVHLLKLTITWKWLLQNRSTVVTSSQIMYLTFSYFFVCVSRYVSEKPCIYHECKKKTEWMAFVLHQARFLQGKIEYIELESVFCHIYSGKSRSATNGNGKPSA